MLIEILEIARREHDEANEFYEIEQPGWKPSSRNKSGIPFSAFNNILKHGRPSAKKSGGISSINSRTSSLYSIQDDKIVILAFAHLHRQPDYWIDRIK
jgi:hypothetical protein